MMFAIWLAFEPMVVTIAYASDLDTTGVDGIVDIPQPEKPDTSKVDGIVNIDDVMTPVEYLDYMLSLRGRTKAEAEAKAWGDWMMALSGAYLLMDDGCSDVFSFYSAVEVMQPNLSRTPFYFKALSKAAQKTLMAFAFLLESPSLPNGVKVLGRVTSAITGSKVGQGIGTGVKWGTKKVSSIAKWTGNKIGNTKLYKKGVGFIQRKANMFNGFKRMGDMASKFTKNSKIFITHMAPPCGYKDGAGLLSKTRLVNKGAKLGKGEGFYSYWRWVARKTKLEDVGVYRKFAKKFNISTNRGAKVINNTKGIAHTVGIGLCVLGLAMDTYGIATSDDRKGGRGHSWSLVKNYVSAGIGAASLVAMFCVPFIGQVAGLCALAWFAISSIGDAFGAYNKKWKAAYKNSYWYLYNNDAEFRSFYNNRSYLNDEEKAAALIIAEKKYGQFATGDAVVSDDDTSIPARNQRVFIALEKQGVLMSYYSQKGFTLPDFSMDRLKELWQMKADYMSWKPTAAEEKKASKRGFWGKVGHYVNPMTYVSWAGDKIKSSDYKKTIREYNLQKVFFNPDYVLIKKYQNWITANKCRGGIFDIVGLRIEQSPFNYIPLVAIDSSAWSEELLDEAFNADAFQVGVKEMIYFREQIKLANEQIKKTISTNDDAVELIRDVHLKHAKQVREALDALVEAYNADADSEHDGLMKTCQKAFGWRWSKDYGDPTPRNIIKVYKADIEQSLTYDPLSLAQKAAETVLMVSQIKENLDMAKMMKELGDEKLDLLDVDNNAKKFNEEFKNYDINKYLKEGTFLDVKGSTFMDWLADIYPAYDEMEKYTNLYNKEVDKYTGTANEANASARHRWYFDKKGVNPRELLKDINNELSEYKEVADKYSDIMNDIDITMPIVDNDKLANGVFKEGGYQPVAEPVAIESLDYPVDSVMPDGD